MPKGHLICLKDWSTEDLERLIQSSLALKREAASGSLSGRSVGLLFFRGSLRTRTSFEAAMHQLGGQVVHLNASDFWDLEAKEGTVMDGRAPEHIKDAAAVLSSYVDALAIRPDVPGQSWQADRRDTRIQAWASYASVPIINMESALWHPLQALADVMTMRESLDTLRGKRLAITWTHSPSPASPSVIHSLLLAALRFGMHVNLAHPAGFELDEAVLGDARAVASEAGSELSTSLALSAAAEGAHVIYARSWESLEDYGNPTLAANRRSRWADWKVDENLMQLGQEARLMHPMPVRRNLEVADEVLDGPRSLVYEQAANRLHSQKALLLELLS